VDAAIFSNTPVTAYLEMSVLRFFEVWQAICAVAERRSKAISNGGHSGPPKPRKAKKKRRR